MGRSLQARRPCRPWNSATCWPPRTPPPQTLPPRTVPARRAPAPPGGPGDRGAVRPPPNTPATNAAATDGAGQASTSAKAADGTTDTELGAFTVVGVLPSQGRRRWAWARWLRARWAWLLIWPV